MSYNYKKNHKITCKEWGAFWNKKNLFFIKYFSFLIPAGHYNYFWIWNQYRALIKKINKNNLSIAELGSGKGLMSLKFLKKYGGQVSLIDYSSEALEFSRFAAKYLLNINPDKIKYINSDIFELKQLKYDLVHSQGLIEHFEDIEQVIKKHLEICKKKGYVILNAPRNSFAYKIARCIIETIFGKWPYGYEVPVNTKKVKTILTKNGARIIKEKKFIFAYCVLAQKL